MLACSSYSGRQKFALSISNSDDNLGGAVNFLHLSNVAPIKRQDQNAFQSTSGCH